MSGLVRYVLGPGDALGEDLVPMSGTVATVAQKIQDMEDMACASGRRLQDLACSATQTAIAEGLGRAKAAVTRAAGKLSGPAGYLAKQGANLLETAVDRTSTCMRCIDIGDRAGIPGLQSETVRVSGHAITVRVDATTTLEGQDPAVYFQYVGAEPDLNAQEQTELANRVAGVVAQAQAELEPYDADSYAAHLEARFENGDPALRSAIRAYAQPEAPYKGQKFDSGSELFGQRRADPALAPV